MKKSIPIILLLILYSSVATAENSLEIKFTELSINSPAGSMSPHLSTSKSNITILNWLEPHDKGYRIKFVELDSSWGQKLTVYDSDNMFINWADFPSVINFNENEYAAHWLEKNGDYPYAYDAFISVSKNKGKTWSPPIMAHNDNTQTEHGFLSFYEHRNKLGYIYLDGRKMENEITDDISNSGMSLRSGVINRDLKLEKNQNIDGLVCECCHTDVTETDQGPIAVYRNRSKDEKRDIHITMFRDGEWSKSKPVYIDDWEIYGCPVNGPAIIGHDENITVAWFTGANERSSIKVAQSTDYGLNFHEPIQIGINETAGHIDMTADENMNIWLLWQKTKDNGLIELVLTKIEKRTNKLSHMVIEKTGKTPRFSFPQITHNNGMIILAYTTVINDSRETRSSNRKTSIKSLSFNANLY